MKVRFLSAVVCSAILNSAAVAFSQTGTSGNDSSSLPELDPIVVTATKTNQQVSTAPAAISVVEKEDIARHSFDGIDEALKYEAGVYNKRAKGLAESMAGTVIRGFAGANQVLVLVDGQPMNNGYEGRVQFNHIQTDDIDRIEVVRGPFSSLYGGNAMGGVISLITRKPVKKEFHSRSHYGTYGTYGLSTSYGDYIAEKLGFRVSIGNKHSEGYVSDDIIKALGKKGSMGTMVTGVEEVIDRGGARKVQIGSMGANGSDNWNINCKLYYDPADNHSITLGVQNGAYRYWRDYGASKCRDSLGNAIDTGYVTYRLNDTTYYQKLTQNSFLDGPSRQATTYYTLGYDGTASEKISLRFRGGLANMYESWYTSLTTASTRGDGAGKISSTPSMRGNAELTVQLAEALPRQTVLAGISVEGASAENEEWGLSKWYDEKSKTEQVYMARGKSGSGAFFLQDEISIIRDGAVFKSLSAFAGARVDYWRSFDGANRDFTSPKVNNTYDPVGKYSVSPKLAVVPALEFGEACAPSFRIAGGKAFRPPSIYDMFKTWVSNQKVIYQSNPKLEPEETWSLEGGSTTLFWKKRIQLSLTGYYNLIENLIYNSSKSDTLKLKSNAGKAKTKGIETGIVFAPVPFWKAYSNYTWTDSRIVENATNPESEGCLVTGVPEHVFQIGTGMNWKGISFAIDGRYVSQRYSLDDNSDTVTGVYGARDPVMTWDMAFGYTINKNITMLLKIDNLADKIVYDYYRMPGRTITGEVKVDF